MASIYANHVYVSVVEDRHTDVGVQVFRNARDAIEFAKNYAADRADSPEDIEEQDIDGWLYFATYSVEGDCVSVRRIEVDEYVPE